MKGQKKNIDRTFENTNNITVDKAIDKLNRLPEKLKVPNQLVVSILSM